MSYNLVDGLYILQIEGVVERVAPRLQETKSWVIH